MKHGEKPQSLDDLFARAEHYANFSMRQFGRVPPAMMASRATHREAQRTGVTELNLSRLGRAAHRSRQRPHPPLLQALAPQAVGGIARL